MSELKSELLRIIEREMLFPVFQPIVSVNQKHITGYQALIRGPSDSRLHSSLDLFAAAERYHQLARLELLSQQICIHRFAQLKLPGKLFLKALASTFLDDDSGKAKVPKIIKTSGLNSTSIIIELSELQTTEHNKNFQEAALACRNAGLQIAIDHLGSRHYGMRLLSQMQPDYLKIDRHYVRGLHEDNIKFNLVRSIRQMAMEIDAEVIAAGIETIHEYQAILKIGIAHAQGFYFAGPALHPLKQLDTEHFIQEFETPNGRLDLLNSKTVATIAKAVVPVQADKTVEKVMDLYHHQPELNILPIVDNEKAIGLIVRDKFFNKLFSSRYGIELQGKHLIKTFISDTPLSFDKNTSIAQASKQLTTALRSDHAFVITDSGVYFGIATILDLLVETLEARALADEQLRMADSLFQNSSEGMFITDVENRIISVNPAFTTLTGYSLDDVLGKNPRMLGSGRECPEFYQDLWRQLVNKGHWQGEIQNRRKNGEMYTEWLVINNIYDNDGKLLQRAAIFSDITEKKKTEEMFWLQANYDPLTQLPNRRLFGDRLQQEIRKSQRDNQLLGLMFLDLDHFKEVNDTLGHRVGDALLIDAAHRINTSVRGTDTVARLGGDEFTVIVTELNDVSDLDRIAQGIIDALCLPFFFGDDHAYISASIGIAIYPADTNNCDDLLRYADQAMYAAKNKGRNGFSYFTPAMQESARQRMTIANDLHQALKQEQFELYYQPIVDLGNDEIYKAEALIRWLHPERGMISPLEFIPISEETGLILDIGDWVFRQAAQQVKVWRETSRADFQISINKSPVQFKNAEKPIAHWLSYLQEIGLTGDSIVIEITEGLLLDAGKTVYEKLLNYSKNGVQVAIDDFGTGYSAMSYLKKFDIDYLKIDQSFTRNLAPGSDDMALSEAIVMMAHKLGLKVIAEGVETPQQCELLKQIGCDYAQGYLFSRPLTAEAFSALLEK